MIFGNAAQHLADIVGSACEVDSVLRETEHLLRVSLERGFVPDAMRGDYRGLLQRVREQLELPAYVSQRHGDELVDLGALEAECQSAQVQRWQEDRDPLTVKEILELEG